MSLDSITEQIAHFIGAFEITTEQARLRDQYEEFTALRRKAELEDLDDPTRIQIKADLKLDPGKHDPLPFKFAEPQGVVPPQDPLPVLFKLGEVISGTAVEPDFQIPEAPPFSGFGQLTIVLEPEYIQELIGSAVTYTFQTIILNDNDTIGEGDFRDVEALMEKAEGLLDLALSLHGILIPSIHIEDYQSGEAVEELIDQIQSPITIEVAGATVHQFHGDEATGIIVNGEYVDEMPEYEDLLPAHLRPEEENEEGEDDTPDLYPVEWNRPDEPEFQEGHSATAGGNLAINEVNLTVSWVDAPNIVVGGDVMNLAAISQVAVVRDIDEGLQSNTHVIQASEVDVEAKTAPWMKHNIAAEPDQDPIVTIDWIPGDVLVTNFIKQVIDTTDIDQIFTEITADSSAYTLGENIMTNVTNILQSGNFYDMIIVGGDMVSLDVVNQTIAFSDNDVVHGAHATDEDHNLVMNEVSLKTTGEDTHEKLTDNLASTVGMQEVDAEALEDALLNDPLFAGTELLRVLKIEGDLLQVNIIEQVTKMLDDDDIYVETPGGETVSALGGGNAVLNTASVNKLGIDSVIMAQEEAYPDLMLHQASLIDNLEEENTELVNEAIAILMEEMDATGDANDVNGGANLTTSEMASADDGLQTMLA